MGVDLSDLYRGSLSPRRLWVLVKNLSGDSPLYRALRAAEAEAEAKAKAQAIDDAEAMIRRGSRA